MEDQEPIAAPERLGPVPPGFALARRRLHELAQEVISPPRERATGRIGLRATPGGFGTPPFDGEQQVRLEGAELVFREAAGSERREPANVDRRAAAFLADWYAFAAARLLELRALAGEDADASLVQLWPEHFDIAVELGREPAGERATYGFSPGDEAHEEPYVYVAPWTAPPPSALWQAEGFTGAELAYSALLTATSQRAMALEFLQARWAALTG